ncbi:MAG: DMT family transporter [Bacilli bacterium]|nr:DMT family transporter [Bacilli bacterium]
MWSFLIVSTLSWGIAEIFYKKGNLQNEKYSHLKTTFFVGLFMGIYAFIILFTQGVDLQSFPINFLYYLPVSACYILSMVLSYFGVRFIEESIADPIENSSIAIVPILCAIFLKQTFSLPAIIGIVIVTLGVILLGVFDKKGKTERRYKYGKKLAIIAMAMPFCYMLLDSVGTFLDIFYVEDINKTILVGVNEYNLVNTANCCYELTFFLVAIGIFIFLKIKKVKLFDIEGSEVSIKRKWYEKAFDQKWKLLAALFETIGQATYLYALSSGQGIAAVILGAGTVIISLLLSRILLKEKLSIIQYIFIFIIVGGIITLCVCGV